MDLKIIIKALKPASIAIPLFSLIGLYVYTSYLLLKFSINSSNYFLLNEYIASSFTPLMFSSVSAIFMGISLWISIKNNATEKSLDWNYCTTLIPRKFYNFFGIFFIIIFVMYCLLYDDVEGFALTILTLIVRELEQVKGKG